MYTTLSAIGKNIILLGILALSMINFFYSWFGWKELLAIQSLAGLAYIFLSCYEFLNAQYKASLPVQRYTYVTNSYLLFKVLKVSVYFGFAIALYLTGSRVKYFYPICVLIGLTEGIVTFMKYKRGVCFISIYANYLLLSQEKLTKLFASEILLAEFRHNIFYFVKKNRKTNQINMEHIKDKDQFIRSMNEWIKRNKINIGGESDAKLAELLNK